MSGLVFFFAIVGVSDMDISFSVDEVATIVGAVSVKGKFDGKITGIAGLSEARGGDLSFLGNSKYRSAVAGCGASVILLPEDFEGEPAAGQVFVLVKNPSMALAIFCKRIEQTLWPKPEAGVHASAVVSPGAVVAASATVGPLCVVEEGAVIGENVFLMGQVFVGRNARVGAGSRVSPNVSIMPECVLGERVFLHSGVVIGSDGFGYEFMAGRHEKVPQVGIVEIGNDVEIGANSAIDRGRFRATVIGEGTKIDNLVQVGHNVVLGKHCIVCGQAGISGSVTAGDYVVFAGQAGISGHLKIGNGAKIGPQAGVTGDIAEGVAVFGTPCLPFNVSQRLTVLQRRLPDLFERVGDIEKQLGITKKTFSAKN